MKVNANQPWDLSRLSASAPTAADPGGEVALNKRADAVASQFEQLLLRQMLSQMRASSFNAEVICRWPTTNLPPPLPRSVAWVWATRSGAG